MGTKDQEFQCLEIKATQSSFARLVGVSQPTINKHVRAGFLTEGQTLHAWLIAYTSKIRIEASGRGDSGDPLREATINEKIARTKKIEVETKEKEGTLVDRAEVIQEIGPVFDHFKRVIEASGGRLVGEIERIYGVKIDRKLIDREHREALILSAAYTGHKKDLEGEK